MNIHKNLACRIDIDKLQDALKAADFLAHNFIKNGRFRVDETWGPEGVLYLAESSYALCSIYEVTKKELYLDAVKAILKELKRIQKPSGGWALELGASGVGFKITEKIRQITKKIEDLPPTVAVLKTIADYQKLSHDTNYYSMGERAFNYLIRYWDEEYGSFLEKNNNELTALRSNPRSYHLFSFKGIQAWQAFSPDKTKKILPNLLSFIKKTFESYDHNTMPLIYGLHAAILLEESDEEYRENIIKPRIDNHLLYNNIFRIPGFAGCYGHCDGLRGVVTTESHMRSCAGIAIACKFYDLISNTKTYRDTSEYKDIENWIQSMRGEGFYYEFQTIPEEKRIGYGSPGQYLPIWWVLGKI